MWRVLAILVAGCGFQGPDAAAPIDAHHAPGPDAPVVVDGPVAMGPPIEWIQQNGTSVVGGSGFVVGGFQAPQAAHDLVIATIAWITFNTPVDIATVTDTLHSTYTQIGTTATAGTFSQAVFYVADAMPGTNTVTVAFAGVTTSPDIRLVEYRGISATSPIDQMSATSGGAATSFSAPPLTTTHANDLLLGINTVGHTSSAGTGFTERFVYNGDLIEDEVLSSAGSYTATARQDEAEAYVFLAVAFEGIN